MTPIAMKTTQYGLSRRAGGWDPDGDAGTDQWKGDRGNTLNLSSCALTQTAEAQLATAFFGEGITKLHAGCLLKLTFSDNRIALFRTFDDRAPEADPRLDIFNPWGFDSRIPDHGWVEVVL